MLTENRFFNNPETPPETVQLQSHSPVKLRYLDTDRALKTQVLSNRFGEPRPAWSEPVSSVSQCFPKARPACRWLCRLNRHVPSSSLHRAPSAVVVLLPSCFMTVFAPRILAEVKRSSRHFHLHRSSSLQPLRRPGPSWVFWCCCLPQTCSRFFFSSFLFAGQKHFSTV